MLRDSKELWYAVAAGAVISGVYALVILAGQGIPAASGFFGHTLGVVGFILMLLTETLYSLRKRTRAAKWGPMAQWLQFHIFTGLVGPYMVLLHTSWKFNGLAGVVTLFTVVIVVSGFVGRYIYTRLPRTADGFEDEGAIARMQRSTVTSARRLMAVWHTVHIPIGMALFTSAFVHIGGALYYATLLK